MDMKIRCSECRKKISVDEGFAGGMARCPYCKAIVPVPTSRTLNGAKRPAAPKMRPGSPRPSAPSAAAKTRPAAPPGRTRPPAPATAPQGEGAAAAVHREQHVAMAKPVRLQGTFTMVLIGLLGVVVAALVYVLVTVASTPSEPETAGGGGRPAPSTEPADVGEAPAEVNPFVPSARRPAILNDVPVEPPVVYLLDTGGSMGPIFNWAVDLVRASLISLGEKNTATLIALKDYSTDGATTLFEGKVPGGKATSTKLMEWSETVFPSGPTDPAIPAAVTRALEAKPKTVVLITRRAIENQEAIEALQKVKAAGAELMLIAVGPDRIDRKAHVSLAEKLGATYRWVPTYRLRELRDQAGLD